MVLFCNFEDRLRVFLYFEFFFSDRRFWSQTLNFSAIKIFNRGSLASGRCDQSLNVRPVNEQRLDAQVGR